jgi:hypothetical protein
MQFNLKPPLANDARAMAYRYSYTDDAAYLDDSARRDPGTEEQQQF